MPEFKPDNLLVFQNESTDPGINLALEEYLLRSKTGNFLIIWHNERAIVTGKHQVSYREVNYPFCLENNIAVHRRLSGGGTVYHDMGNLNFTMIENRPDKTKLIDFARYLRPVSAFLHELGIPAELSNRNDILVGGFKVSGNAQHVEQRSQRVIHHGTLLINADLDSLREGLRPTRTTYESKGVDSVRSKVINLSELDGISLDTNAVTAEMADYFIRRYNGSSWKPEPHEMEAVRDLAENKYNTWQWNIGYSPKYTARTVIRGSDELELNVKDGHIEQALLHSHGKVEKLAQLAGRKHDPKTMQEACSAVEQLKEVDWRMLF